MTSEYTIPLLPCRAINEMLVFYQALGFKVTYQQTRPNNYLAVRRGGIELHFFSMRDYKPADSYSTCYVVTTDVDGLYQAFTDGLRQQYGRLPSAGIPRVIPLKNKTGRREFIVVDPGGNWIRIGQIFEESADDPSADKEDKTTPEEMTTRLSRALNAATLLADSKGDYPAAAKMIDAALAQEEPFSASQRIQALVFRAGLAITMDDHPRARTLLAEMRQIPLTDEERNLLAAELARADDLEYMLQQIP